MMDITEYEEFACKCVDGIALAMSKRNFDQFQSFFDPELNDDFSVDDFNDEIDEQEELGALKDFELMGHVKGKQDDLPDFYRFVFKGVFKNGEGLILISVHERDNNLYLNEHVYYW